MERGEIQHLGWSNLTTTTRSSIWGTLHWTMNMHAPRYSIVNMYVVWPRLMWSETHQVSTWLCEPSSHSGSVLLYWRAHLVNQPPVLPANKSPRLVHSWIQPSSLSFFQVIRQVRPCAMAQETTARCHFCTCPHRLTHKIWRWSPRVISISSVVKWAGSLG